jgi:uncharacterized small protein (DUF1192 family)
MEEYDEEKINENFNKINIGEDSDKILKIMNVIEIDKRINIMRGNKRVMCILDSCASYENESCLEHVENKCIPDVNGCKYVFLTIYFLCCY